jgi:hypothetical protein
MNVANTFGETLTASAIDAAVGMIGADVESPSAVESSITSR